MKGDILSILFIYFASNIPTNPSWNLLRKVRTLSFLTFNSSFGQSPASGTLLLHQFTCLNTAIISLVKCLMYCFPRTIVISCPKSITEPLLHQFLYLTMECVQLFNWKYRIYLNAVTQPKKRKLNSTRSIGCIENAAQHDSWFVFRWNKKLSSFPHYIYSHILHNSLEILVFPQLLGFYSSKNLPVYFVQLDTLDKVQYYYYDIRQKTFLLNQNLGTVVFKSKMYMKT